MKGRPRVYGITRFYYGNHMIMRFYTAWERDYMVYWY